MGRYIEAFELKISIIIPIYNTRPYIKECIESVVNQSYRNLEIILVDDGSTDGCAEICDEYARTDARVRVIHKPNGGLVSARKLGITICTGEYIAPIDSDDYVSNNMIEQMVNAVKLYNAEIVQCGVRYHYSTGEFVDFDEPLENGLYNLENINSDAHKCLFWDFTRSKRGIRSNMWSCLFKKDLIYKYQMLVPDDLTNGEDDACFYPTFLNAKSYYLIDKPLYNHFFRMGSMSSTEGSFTLKQMTQIDELIRPCLGIYMTDSKLYLGYKRYLLFRIEIVMRNNYKIGLTSNYRFPSDVVPYNSKVVVYGAGKIGQSFVAQNESVHWFDMVAWVDSYREDTIFGKRIEKPDVIRSISYDFILIAIDKRKYAEVREHLIEIGYAEKILLWKEPVVDNSTWFFFS